MYERWLELDRLLVQLWESHSICPKVAHCVPQRKGGCSWLDSLLPELTKRGAIGLIECEWLDCQHFPLLTGDVSRTPRRGLTRVILLKVESNSSPMRNPGLHH